MIKIIKEGIKPTRINYYYKWECDNCKCEWVFDEEEIEFEKRLDGNASFICPCCKRLFTIPRHQLPLIEVEEEIDGE